MFDNPSLAGLGLLCTTVAFAAVERIRHGGLSTAPRLDPDPAPLRRAAEIAYDYARARKLPLAAIAERRGAAGDPVAWFENSLLKAVPVAAQSVASGSVKVLGALARANMHAVPNGIAKSAGGEAAYCDPTVSARDFKAYLRWARSVW